MDEMLIDEVKEIEEVLNLQGIEKPKQEKSKKRVCFDEEVKTIKVKTKKQKRKKEIPVVNSELEVTIEINASLFSNEDEDAVFNVIKGDYQADTSSTTPTNEFDDISNIQKCLNEIGQYFNRINRE